MGQRPAQFLVRPVDMHAGGSFGASQGIANLFIGQFQKVSHRHRHCLPTRKSQKGAGNIVTQFPPVYLLLDGAVSGVQEVGIDQSLFPRSAT